MDMNKVLCQELVEVGKLFNNKRRVFKEAIDMEIYLGGRYDDIDALIWKSNCHKKLFLVGTVGATEWYMFLTCEESDVNFIVQSCELGEWGDRFRFCNAADADLLPKGIEFDPLKTLTTLIEFGKKK